MKIQKLSKFYARKISRRKSLISGAKLMAACCMTSNMTTLSTINKFEVNSITIDEDYVLVDGWLLRADDLVS